MFDVPEFFLEPFAEIHNALMCGVFFLLNTGCIVYIFYIRACSVEGKIMVAVKRLIIFLPPLQYEAVFFHSKLAVALEHYPFRSFTGRRIQLYGLFKIRKRFAVFALKKDLVAFFNAFFAGGAAGAVCRGNAAAGEQERA
ncbi:MAG: hypothetical protein LBO78_00275 [Rickettsiales bacterium]|nr:hypothetical protein [Rickettsiales bacterium]